MEKQESRIRIDLTNEQTQQIKETSGKTVTALEFTVQELEDRIAPITFNYASVEYNYTK